MANIAWSSSVHETYRVTQESFLEGLIVWALVLEIQQ